MARIKRGHNSIEDWAAHLREVMGSRTMTASQIQKKQKLSSAKSMNYVYKILGELTSSGIIKKNKDGLYSISPVSQVVPNHKPRTRPSPNIYGKKSSPTPSVADKVVEELGLGVSSTTMTPSPNPPHEAISSPDIPLLDEDEIFQRYSERRFEILDPKRAKIKERIEYLAWKAIQDMAKSNLEGTKDSQRGKLRARSTSRYQRAIGLMEAFILTKPPKEPNN